MLNKQYPRYKDPNLSMYERFIVPDEESSKWNNEYSRIMRMPRGFARGGLMFKHMMFSKVDKFGFDILKYLHAFTIDEADDDEVLGLADYLMGRYPQKVKQITNEDMNITKIELNNDIINAAKLSYVFPDVEEDFPDVVTSKRKGQCHEMSMILLQSLEADNKVVATGPAWSLSPKATILHSWIECDIDEMPMVCDFTYNLVIDKDAYYKLFHIEKPYQKITLDEFEGDLPLLRAFHEQCPNFEMKLYLSSREEALEYIKKGLIESARKKSHEEDFMQKN